MDLTKRRNAVLIMTMVLMLTIAAVLAVYGFVGPAGLTMVAPEVLAA